MSIRFRKLHGLGNDYVYVACQEHEILDPAALSVKVSDRHTGVGSDGLILILPPNDPQTADFRMRMFNADGSESEMCGNGIRCIGKFVFDHGLTTKRELAIETGGGGLRYLELQTSGDKVDQVRVQMGEPVLERARIPLSGEPADEAVVASPFHIGEHTVTLTAVSMGNPHAVIQVPDVETAPVITLGPVVERDPLFPQRVNVEFCQVVSPTDVVIRVWERGSGETQACGTGACATLVACVLEGRTERRARVRLRGGDLFIEWPEGGPVYMTGPAVEVFSGVLDEAWLSS